MFFFFCSFRSVAIACADACTCAGSFCLAIVRSGFPSFFTNRVRCNYPDIESFLFLLSSPSCRLRFMIFITSLLTSKYRLEGWIHCFCLKVYIFFLFPSPPLCNRHCTKTFGRHSRLEIQSSMHQKPRGFRSQVRRKSESPQDNYNNYLRSFMTSCHPVDHSV